MYKTFFKLPIMFLMLLIIPNSYVYAENIVKIMKSDDGTKEFFYDESSIKNKSGRVEVITGLNYIGCGQFDDVKGTVCSSSHLTSFICSAHKGKYLSTSFYGGSDGKGSLLKGPVIQKEDYQPIAANTVNGLFLRAVCKK
jgi:hypothetical protein